MLRLPDFSFLRNRKEVPPLDPGKRAPCYRRLHSDPSSAACFPQGEVPTGSRTHILLLEHASVTWNPGMSSYSAMSLLPKPSWFSFFRIKERGARGSSLEVVQIEPGQASECAHTCMSKAYYGAGWSQLWKENQIRVAC